MITTIIFDLSEVYLRGLWGTAEKLAPLLKISSEEIDKGFHIEDLKIFFEGKISEDEYWKKVIEKNNWKIDIGVLKEAVRSNFQEIEGSREIIEDLKNKGFKLGLLSVHTREWIDYCEKKFDFHKLFHSVLYSFDVKICKPDEKAYKMILKKLNVKPGECLFIDDYVLNLDAAKKIGINVLQFKDSKQLKKDLNLFLN